MPGSWHSEEQRIRFDHVRVAGFKLAAGNQQGGVGAQLGLDPGARVWVQRDLLLSCGDLLHRTAHVLHRKQEKETSCVFHLHLQAVENQQRKFMTHTFLFLWQTLTRSTSRDTEFCSFSLSWESFPANKQHKRFPVSHSEVSGNDKTKCRYGKTYQLYGRSQ